MHRNFKSQAYDHYFVDFLEKGEYFDFNHSLVFVYPNLYFIKLLGQVSHFSLLNYLCSFYFHALMLVALWE